MRSYLTQLIQKFCSVASATGTFLVHDIGGLAPAVFGGGNRETTKSFAVFKKLIVASSVFMLSSGLTGLYATNYTVNNSSDANTGSGTTGTLRYCITQANMAPGPHVITFSGVTSTTFASDYPQIVRNITIDGGPGKVIIQCTAGNAGLRPFFLNAGSSGSKLLNLDIRGGGYEPIRIDGSPNNITIQDIICSNSNGDYWNYGVYITGNANNYVIRNFVMKNIENGFDAIQIAGTSTNVTIEHVRIIDGPGTSGMGMRFIGVANNVSITDCYINLKTENTTDDGDRGIRFETTTTDLTMTNDTILYADVYSVEIIGTLTNCVVNNLQCVTGSYGDARGFFCHNVVTGISMDNVYIDMDVYTTNLPAQDDGNYGIYFASNVSDMSLNHITMHDAEVYSLYVGGTLTGTNSLLNSTFDEYDGYGGYEMIRFNSSCANLTMTNVAINCDQTGTTDDSNNGIAFVGATTNTTLTNVSVREADDNGIYFWTSATNVSITGGTLKKNYDGIEFYNCNYNRANVDLTNITIDSSERYGVLWPSCTGGANDDVDFTGCTITNSGYDGIYLFNANVASDVTISGCTIRGNGRTSNAGDGIQVQAPDNVIITQNSIYDNAGLGINHTGNGNCNLEGALAPIINSVTPIGGNQYTVNFTIPPAAGPGTFKVEFFTNNPISGVEGEYYVSSVSGLSAGAGQTTTITTNTGPASTPKTANLTMTFTRTGASCNGTSEFSNAMALDPQGPGCVNNGIVGWYRADKITGLSNGQSITQLIDFSGSGNKFKQYVANEQPSYFSGDVTTNFNPSMSFDGADDNLELTNGLLPANTGATLLSAQYHTNIAETWARIYDQNTDDPSLIKQSGDGQIRFWDNGNLGQTFNTRLFVNNVSAIRGFDYGTTSGTTNMYFDGVSSASLGATPSPEAGIGYIGGLNNGQNWHGKIHELVFYSRELTATERQKINTYLSIRWGVSIDTTIMKVAGTGNDYITSDGTVIWTANTGYYHRITGIGRDDCDSLIQKQSRNVNTTNQGYATMGLGTIAATNAANPNNFAGDKRFIVFGDDNKSGATTTTITGDGTITLMGGTCAQYSRLAKTFRVQETGTVGVVRLEFNMTGVKLGKTAADYYLAINNTDVFSGTITKLVAASSYDNVTGIIVFDNVDFASGSVQYFTVVGKRVYGPANITGNLKLWLKAEDGISATHGNPVDIWGDQGPGGNDVTQSNSTLQPIYNSTSNLINFNPSLKFDGANDILVKTTGSLTNSAVYTGATIFSVNNSENSAAGQRIFRQAATADVNLYAPHANTTYFDAPDRIQNTNSNFSSKAVNITTGVKDNSGANTPPGTKQVIYNNGKSIVTGNGASTYTGNNGSLSIGSNNVGSEFHNGYIGEMIYYSAALTPTDRQKVHSYLSLKWGVSLDQTSATDYLAADGSVIWNATTNTAYKYRITGIGREDCSDLIQRQSRNQDTTSAYATIGLGTIAATNIGNTNNFSTDKSYLIWGDDNVAGATATSVTGDGTITLTSNGCGVFRRLAKTFKVAKTGTVGTVQIQVNLRGITLGKVAADHYLAINSSASFTGVITKLVQASSYSGGVLTFNNVTLSDGQYFTVIGQKAAGPANLTANLKLWLRAEDGITLNGGTVESWTDQGPAGNDAAQNTLANQPTYNSASNLINFNPTVSFNGSNRWLRTASNIFGTGNISYTTFGIVDHNSLAGNDYYLSDGSVGGSQAAWFGHQGALQAQANWANDLAAGPIALNTPYLEGFTRDAASNTKTNYQSAKFMGSNTSGAINKTNNGWGEIGANTVNTELWNGKVGELIAFQSVLTDPELQKIYSYLAVKWGFTLDQTSPYDYVSANGSVIWNATTYVAYKNRITGIGRDDCSDLQQKQSKSVETGALVTISNGTGLAATNDLNASTYSADNSWLLFGDNNKGLTWTGSGVPINGGNVRLNRVWRVKETGTVGVVYLEVPDNTSSQAIKLPATTNNIYLLVANSATSGKFSAMSGVTVQLMSFDATNKKWYTTYNFTDGDYFTFGSEKVCIAPVGISEGLTAWYHATDLATGPVGATLSDLAFGVYPLNRNGSGTVVAGSATSFNYNRSITLGSNASFTKGALNNTDVIDATAGSMFAVGTSNANLFAISSSGSNSSGVLATNAQFNGTNSAYGSGVAGMPNVFAMIGSTTNVKGYTNGTAGIASGSIAARASGTYTLGFGQNGSNATYNNGSIAEAFAFNRVLDPEEKDILESYLAIKYGQTLSHNYFNADYDGSNAGMTTIYDISTYPNRVFGIGTDTTGCFYQKQSTSALTGSMLKMSLGSAFAAENSGNTSVFTQDRSYVMAGDDNGSVAAWVTGGGGNPNTPALYETTCELPKRIARQWKVTGTYATPTVLFAIPDATSSEATKLPAVTAGYSVWMVVNGNADFGMNALQQEIAMTLNGTTLNWEGTYQVPAGATKYITFVMKNNNIATGASAPMIVITETDNSCIANDGYVTSGATAILTPTSGNSYSWNTGATTSSLTVNPTMNTTYTVTVTASNGCTGSATSSITIAASPTATIAETDISCAVNDSKVLSGDQATLTASGGSTYVWDNASTLAARNVAPTSTTTYTVTVTDVDGCTASASATITIVTAPVVSLVGANSICIGDMTTVSPSSGGTWASSNASVATVTNAGVVTGVSGGSAVFTFTSSATGCMSASTPAVTVNPTPAVSITGSNNICVGSTTTLSPSSGGTWVSNAPSVATVTDAGVVTGVTAGTATFTFTNSTTGCVSAPTSAVTVSALPVVGITGASTICAGATTTLSPTSGGTWASSNVTIATVTNAGVVTGLSGGAVTFTYTKNTAPNCSATTATVTVNDLPIVSISGSGTICVGTTTTLLPATGGTWVSSNNAVATVTNAGVVTGVSGGNVTFTFTSTATGCSATTPPVTVNALPVVSITGANGICTGFTTTLSPTSGGTWASSAPVIATVTNAGVVTGVAAGSATFTFTSTATGCTSLPTAAVTVTALPVVSITGMSTICVGTTTTLSPASGGTWVSSDPSLATVTNAGVVTGVAAGSVTFTFTSSTSPNCSATTPAVTLLAQPAVSITGSGTICAGATTTLSPTSGGTWASSDNAIATVTNAGVVTGVSAGTATFTFTSSGTGCVSLPTPAVTVNALPVVAITGSGSICAGLTTTLSPTSGGTWASNAPAIATVTNAGVVTGVSAGTATFTFTSSTTGCASAPTAPVTVNAIPIVSITGASSICIGASSGLTPTSGGTWVSSNASVATVTNAGVVTGVSAGTATFTFTNSTTGCVSAPTAAITVNPTPAVSITGSASICIGSTTTLSPTNGIWASSDPSVATVTNAGVVTGVSAGTATFTFTNTSTGCQSAPTSPVTVNAPPVVSITGSSSICVGFTTVLAPTSGGTWTSSDPSVATVTNAGLVTGVSAGLATFTFTNTSTGCVSVPTAPVTVNPLPVVGISGPNAICVGYTTGLSPSTGGTWASSNAAVATVTNSGVVTGVSAGTATFTFTSSSTGCMSVPTGTVTVYANPVVSITGSNSICVGATTTLSPSSGGTWVSTNSGVATVTNAGVVTAVSAGTATFIFTSTSTGCVSAPTPAVTVNSTPIVSVVGSSNLCIGGTTGLSPSSGGTWVSSNNAVATVTNAGVVTAVSAGTATFTFTDGTSGCVSLPTTPVTVNPAPVVSITGATTICAGSTTTLSPTSGGTWVSSAPGIASVTSGGVVTGVSAGTATFTFTNTATGCVSAPTGAVTVNSLPVVSITGTSNICVGGSTTLSPTSGGIWTSSNIAIATVTNAGIVSGVSAGNASFTFTNSITGCVSAYTPPVTVNPLPVVSITGASSICVGGATTLSPTSGGTWVSSNPAVATVTNAGVVTGVSGGTATFTFTNTATGCVSAATSAVTVNPTPVALITGSSSICIGATTVLSPTSGGTWVSSAPAIATVTNAGVVTGVSAGTATFTFTNTATGCVSMPTPAVTVNAAPVVSITGTTSICVGNTTTLSPTSGGSWASSNAAVATVTNAGVVTGVSAGTATFIFTNSITGCMSAPTPAVTVNAIPIVSITGGNSICVGATTTLSPASGGTWTSSNPAVATVTNGGVVTGVSGGTATFTFTLTATGCISAATAPVTVNAAPVATLTGSSSICIGATTTLSPTSGGVWVSSNPAVATVTNSGVVTGVSAGTATFTYTSNTTTCASAPVGPVTVAACNSLAAVKAFLGGPYDAGTDLMNDDLRTASLIPVAQPYGGVQYPDFNYNGTETIGGGVLSVGGANAIVDWVMLELRNASNPAIVVARKAALVQRDGDVVESADGVSPVTFIGTSAGNYYVAIKHRNHLGVMTSSAVALSGTMAVSINFTSAATGNYQLSGPTGTAYAQRTLANGKRAMWEGNMSAVNGSGNQIQYQGSNSDSDEAYFRVLLDPFNLLVIPNFIVNAYDRSDGNMDGMVIYQGGDSDSDIPFFNVLPFPDNVLFLPNFIIFQQIP